MIEEQTIVGENIRTLSDGTLEVRDATVIMRDGKVDPSFAPRFHRYVLHPGDSLTGQPEKVIAVAKSIWTDEVIAAWREAQAAVTANG